MKSSLKLVIFFKLFEGEVVFELVFKLFELNRPSIFRIKISLVFELVVVFRLFDWPLTFWIGIFLVFKLMIVFLNSLKMWLSFNLFSNSSKAGSSLNSFSNSSNLALYFPDRDFLVFELVVVYKLFDWPSTSKVWLALNTFALHFPIVNVLQST